MTAHRTTRRRRVTVAAALAAGVIGTSTGCTNVTPEPDEFGIMYHSGPVEAVTFDQCVKPGGKAWGDIIGGKGFTYPAGLRTYDFKGAEQSEADPIKVPSSDKQEMTLAGYVEFRLNGEDCDVLRAFHDNLGLKNVAYNVDGLTSEGWDELLDLYVGQPLQRAMQTEIVKYGWLALWSEPAKRADIEKAIADELNRVIPGFEGKPYFLDFRVTLQTPQPPPELLNLFRQAEEATQREATIKANDAALAAERAQIREMVALLGQDGYIQWRLLEQCEDDKPETPCVSMWPLPVGADVVVPAP
jgi:hypothetical protein